MKQKIINKSAEYIDWAFPGWCLTTFIGVLTYVSFIVSSPEFRSGTYMGINIHILGYIAGWVALKIPFYILIVSGGYDGLDDFVGVALWVPVVNATMAAIFSIVVITVIALFLILCVLYPVGLLIYQAHKIEKEMLTKNKSNDDESS